MVKWVFQLGQDIVFHRLKIQDSCTANIEGESADLADPFALPCRVRIIFGTARNKLGDDVTTNSSVMSPRKSSVAMEG